MSIDWKERYNKLKQVLISDLEGYEERNRQLHTITSEASVMVVKDLLASTYSIEREVR